MDKGVSRGFITSLQVYNEIVEMLNGVEKCDNTLRKILKKRAIGAVSSLHAITQMIIVVDLCSKGFSVNSETPANGGDLADIYAENGRLSLIVEVESGYVPSRWITRAEEYLRAKVLVKTLRFSRPSSLFILAMPSHIRIPVPLSLLKPPEERTDADLEYLKAEIVNARRFVKSQLLNRYDFLLDTLRWIRIDGLALVNIAEKKVSYIFSKSVYQEGLPRLLSKAQVYPLDHIPQREPYLDL